MVRLNMVQNGFFGVKTVIDLNSRIFEFYNSCHRDKVTPLKNFRRRTGEIKQIAKTNRTKEFEVVSVKAKSNNRCQKELIKD